MGYNKIIVYGENFEIYEYEKNLNESRIRPKITGLCKRPLSILDTIDNDEGVPLAKRLQDVKFAKRKDSAKRASVAFRRLVSCNLGNGEIPLLCTLTYAINQTDISIGYSDFTSFAQAIRYKYGKSIRYIAVPEFQKRGAVHFHALIWGLPESVYNQERKSREIALMWGHGYVDLFKTDGDQKIAGYLSKYMSKAFIDGSLKSQKAYTSSRNVKRPILISGIDSICVVMDDYGIGDNPPCETREFQSQWLGKGRFRLFKI